MTRETTQMKIFQIDDMEWWIGQDAETVRAAVQDEQGRTEEDLEDFEEVSDESLDVLMFQDTDEDELPTSAPRTFREQLAIEVAEGGQFPRLFAAESY
ncbi:hypothetical protein [Xanthomonas arboricola]|uniref:Uncharacterized protein n=1 Tax=Xanthomonas arboricola TaxID=56448 RepID=A0A2S7ADE8_9XANT|nr:hypothetical protein [Xanthomonas arboricola]PPU07768.1 hypothetical protein XarjCFBP7645_09180 [Xanthomonas arboricola]